MSTVSGFLIGALVTATLTVYYGEHLSSSLRDALEQYSPDQAAVRRLLASGDEKTVSDTSQLLPVAVAPAVPELPEQPAGPEQPAELEELAVTEAVPTEPTLEQYWAEFAAQADALQPAGEFPWRPCFQRAAASYEIPESLLLAIASGESNFDPAARSDKDAVGLMQIRWPGTSRHLGVRREADLYDPCTNVDAGARYLVELAGQFDDNLHLVVAAYNYGPGRISAQGIPEGARWYSQYIYQHLQQVLGKKHIPTSDLLRPQSAAAAGRQVLMRFDQSYRARDYITYLGGQVPGLNLRQQSEALGQHDVVLVYRDESERLRALEAIGESGIATLTPRSNNKISL